MPASTSLLFVLLTLAQIDRASLDSLTLVERSELVRNLARRQIDQLTNVRVTYTLDRHQVSLPFKPSEPKLKHLDQMAVTYLYLDGSYRIQMTDTLGGSTKALFSSNSNYVATTGIARMLGEHNQQSNLSARISRSHDNTASNNWYAFMLGGYLDSWRQSFLQYLINETTIITSVEYTDDSMLEVKTFNKGDDKSTTQYTYLLDPRKGYSITRLAYKWDRFPAPNNHQYDYRDTSVEESKEFGGIWLPTKLSMLMTSSHVPGQGTLYSFTVSDLSLGTVTSNDLAVDFPKGSEVLDDIKGVTYIEGEPNTEQPWVGAHSQDGSDLHAGVAATTFRSWAIIGNILLVLIVIILILRNRRMRGTT